MSVEDDEELIKKLMTMLGNGRYIKIKSHTGQTLKVSLDSLTGQCYQPELDWDEPFSSYSPLFHNVNNSTVCSIGNCDNNDFLEEFPQSSANYVTNFEHQISSEENIDSIFFQRTSSRRIGYQIYEETYGKSYHMSYKIAEDVTPLKSKSKKISLTHKVSKKTNEAVLNFMRQEYSSIQAALYLRPPTIHSLPLISHPSDYPVDQRAKSNPVKYSLDFLKETHPYDKYKIELINQRLLQLEKIEKDKQKLDYYISYILSSSISNSLKIDSFDISMLSFHHQSGYDPLCYIFTQYLKRANGAIKKYEGNLPSFLFLYSQPLIDEKGREIEDQINYFEEESIIQKILKEGKCRVDYIRERATIDKFHYWIKQGIEILHFCGHGIQSVENYLLFENDIGGSIKLNPDKCHSILSYLKDPLKLVFVASCHSESTGKVFKYAGALHVICIKDEYQILDEACQYFVKIFYLSCLSSKMTICEAFLFAKKQLSLTGKFTQHYCEKFLLLRNHKYAYCLHLYLKQYGKYFTDLTYRPYYTKNLPSRVENYITRSKDLHYIIKLIDQKRRFITMIGQSGIGKSTLARELVRYVQFRNLFKDGVIYIEIRSCENMVKLFYTLDLYLFENSELKLNKSPQENIQKLVKELINRHVLIVIDNCQNIMASEYANAFKRMVECIMKNCISVFFIFTNRVSITRQLDYCSEMLYELHKLSETQAQSLFFQRVPRKIEKEELDQFFKIYQNLKELSKHSFFEFLNGHPEAICMTASLLSYRSLSYLYDLLLKPSIDLSHYLYDHDLSKKYSPEYSGMNSVVETAMKISLNVLKNKHKYASYMIKILSLLPNGLDSEIMSKLFCTGTKWKYTVNKLISHSLVQCFDKAGSKYFAVHPHIIVHVYNEISQEEKIKLQYRICEYLVKRVYKIYRNVGTLSIRSQRAQYLFLIYYDNLKAVILRYLSFHGDKKYLKELYYNLFENTMYSQYDGYEKYSPNRKQTVDNGKQQQPLQQSAMENPRRRVPKNYKLLQPSKKEPIDILIVYYVTILFVVRKTKNSPIEEYIAHGMTISQRRCKFIVVANLNRLKGCVYFSQNKLSEAKKYFINAWADFAYEGCGLGSASCYAAVGYIKFVYEEYASAKMNLYSSLKYYDEISHPYGKHYLNRWLCSLKSKMNRTYNELINHKTEAQKLLKYAKINLKSSNINNTFLVKHKLGMFVFRFLFDNISLFLEACFEVDLRSKMINIGQAQLKKVEERNMILYEIGYENFNMNRYEAVKKQPLLRSNKIGYK